MVKTLSGINSFLLKAELDRLVAGFVAEHGDFGLERLDGEEVEYNRIMESVQSLPFLAERKMVVLRSGSANKDFAEKIDQALADIPDSTDLLIVETKLDKRLSYYKTLKKKTDFKEYQELDANGLISWLVAAAKERGGEVASGEARYLVERVGSNQQMLSNELNKLISYQPKVTRQTIDLLTDQSPQGTIFELLDAAFAGKSKRAMQLYTEQRALRVEPQQILAMVAWQLHVLAVVKTAGQRTSDEIAREAKLNPFVVRKTQAVARNLTLAQIKKLIHDLLEIDVRLKSESINADDALQNYLLSLSQQ